MLTICWATKGGSGTTVVACALALLNARRETTWLVDLAGDVPAALGMAEPVGAGVLDWVSSATAAQSSLPALAAQASSQLLVIPRGDACCDVDNPRWAALAAGLASLPARVVIDAGSSPPPLALFEVAAQRLLVIRPCYLAIRRSVAADLVPTGIVVVDEPGRALRAADLAHALRAPVVAELTADPAVARAVDAGLLAARLTNNVVRSLEPLTA